ncbi:MAG: FxLYD domain-containing protein [Halobacteria archaeon]
MTSDNTDPETDTVFCTNCGEELSSDAKFCTECGANQTTVAEKKGSDTEPPQSSNQGGIYHIPGISQKNTSRRNVLIGGGYALGGLILLGAAAGDPETDKNGSGGTRSSNGGGDKSSIKEKYPNAEAWDNDTKIALLKWITSEGRFSTKVKGVAVNASDQDYSYVQLQFAFLNSNRTKIGDAYANTSGLDSGQKWRFEAIGTISGNWDATKFVGTTAY